MNGRWALEGGEPRTAYEIIPDVYETELTPATGAWWLAETLCYLTHLDCAGRCCGWTARALGGRMTGLGSTVGN